MSNCIRLQHYIDRVRNVSTAVLQYSRDADQLVIWRW
jgi:hypothetical protein